MDSNENNPKLIVRYIDCFLYPPTSMLILFLFQSGKILHLLGRKPKIMETVGLDEEGATFLIKKRDNINIFLCGA